MKNDIDLDAEWNAIMTTFARDFVRDVDPKWTVFHRKETWDVRVDYLHKSDDTVRMEFVVEVTATSADVIAIDWDRELAGLWRVGISDPADPPVSPLGVLVRGDEARIRDDIALSFRNAARRLKPE
jgi:hypothetical protein